MVNLRDFRRVLFLGDSITYDGRFIDYAEAAVRLGGGQVGEWINLGLSSETVSGLSEPEHAGGQFARPALRERLERALDRIRPDLVVGSYGMNDGIYQALDAERMAAYQRGMTEFRAAVIASGCALVVLTPPVFDGVAARAAAGRGALPPMYFDYDQVVTAYADWLVERRADGWIVTDAHRAMAEALAERRRMNPGFSFSPDGIHPCAEGHAVIARALLDCCGAGAADPLDVARGGAAALMGLISERSAMLRDAWLTAVGHTRPETPPGLALEEAVAAAKEIDRQIEAGRNRAAARI